MLVSVSKFTRRVVLACVLATLPAAGASGTDPKAVTGLWLSSKKKVLVDIYPCEAKALCGKIVWLAKPYKNGKLRLDDDNPDPALRDRGWCGFEIIQGLKPDGRKSWRNGKFYFPKWGQTFDLDIERKSDSSLEMRAYLGVPVLGRSEIWTRPAPDHETGCVSEPQPKG